MSGFNLDNKLDGGSIAKTHSKKIVALIYSMKCLSAEFDLDLYKSILRAYMEYCCHVWAGAPSRHLNVLDKLGPKLVISLALRAQHKILTCVSVFYS